MKNGRTQGRQKAEFEEGGAKVGQQKKKKKRTHTFPARKKHTNNDKCNKNTYKPNKNFW